MSKPTEKELQNSTVTSYRIGVEFVSGIFVGVLFGYAIDSYFHTKPWGMVGFIILGALTGFWNIYKLFNPPAQRKNRDKEAGTQEEREGKND